MEIPMKYLCLAIVALIGMPISSSGNICPDQSICLTNQTCCQTVSGRYGCCPFAKGTCCDDKLHCCPENKRCDNVRARCVRGPEAFSEENDINSQIPWKTTSNKQFNRLMYLLYNRGAVEKDECKGCGFGSTCCEGAGCCSLPNAVCCSGGKHCCPRNSECVFDGLTCLKREDLPNGLLITESEATLIQSFDEEMNNNKLIKAGSKDVPCPGGRFICPDDTTCCPTGPGLYGCCPMPRAVCCSDKRHCCPVGFYCDIPHNKCVQGPLEIPAAVTLPAVEIEKAVICPGSRFKCPDNTTCCEESPGRYGCCPYPQAVCCSDKKHCCPNGTTCDMSHMRCLKGDFSFQSALILDAEALN